MVSSDSLRCIGLALWLTPMQPKDDLDPKDDQGAAKAKEESQNINNFQPAGGRSS